MEAIACTSIICTLPVSLVDFHVQPPSRPLDWSACKKLGMVMTIEFENSCVFLGPFFLQQLISKCGFSASSCNNITLLCVNME